MKPAPYLELLHNRLPFFRLVGGVSHLQDFLHLIHQPYQDDFSLMAAIGVLCQGVEGSDAISPQRLSFGGHAVATGVSCNAAKVSITSGVDGQQLKATHDEREQQQLASLNVMI